MLFVHHKISPRCWTQLLLQLAHWQKEKLLLLIHTPQICLWSLLCSWHNLEILWILTLCRYYCNGHIIAVFLQTIHSCSKIAQTKETDTIPLGNDRAKRDGKYEAQNGSPYPFSTKFLNLTLSLTNIITTRQIPHNLKKTNWIQSMSKNYLMDYTLGQMEFL